MTYGGLQSYNKIQPIELVGPASIILLTFASSATTTVCTTTIYTVTVTDANGCTVNSQVTTISQPSVLASSTSVINNVSCNGGSDGTASDVFDALQMAERLLAAARALIGRNWHN